MAISKLGIIIALLSMVIILLIVSYMLAPIYGMDLFSSASDQDLDMLKSSDVTSSDLYSDYELEHDGMIMERDTGEGDVAGQLAYYDTAMYCEGCSSCAGSTMGGISTVGCQSCTSCDGFEGTYSNCVGCEGSSCLFCDDTSEPTLCKDIKSCIFEYYSDSDYAKANGCFLEAMTHNEGERFDIGALESVLAMCNAESLTMNMGGGVEKELCYFDPSSIAYYGKSSYEYYMSMPEGAFMTVPSNPLGSIYTTQSVLKPFAVENGQTIDRYGIYVSLAGEPGKTYTVKAGSDSFSYPIGQITADSTGFGYGMVYPSGSAELAGYAASDDSKNRMKYLTVDTRSATAKVYYIYSTNGAWGNDLRYSKCNFANNIDSYLSPRPSWSESYGVTSSWSTLDNTDSSIKVFYDSSSASESDDIRGRVKLQLGDLDTNFQKNCMFSLYVCPQDSFAEYEDEGILDLSDLFSYFNPNSIYTSVDIGSNDKVMLYNTFEFKLDKDYTVEEIKSAIKTGFMLWEQNMFPYITLNSIDWLSISNNDGIYGGPWDENPSASASYSDDCWSGGMLSVATNTDQKVIMGNCNNGICSGKVKIRVAFRYSQPTMESPQKQPLYTTVAFCGEGAGTAQVEETPYTGMIGGCEEMKSGGDTFGNYNPFTSTMCQYAWGSGSCSGTQCTCSDGTKTTIADFSVNTGGSGRGFGRTYGCIGNVSEGKDRVTGSCVTTYDDTSSTLYGCSKPERWGDASCTGTGSSSVCSARSDSELTYMETNYLINPYLTNDFSSQISETEGYGHVQLAIKDSPSSMKLVGTCMEVQETYGSYVGAKLMPLPGQKICEYAWGAASCSSNTCACSSGTRKEIAHGMLNIFNEHSMDYGYATLYGCVGS